MPALPSAVIVALGAIGAAVLAKLAVREWRRINDGLDRLRTAPVAKAERAAMRSLRRDPATGIYRPEP